MKYTGERCIPEHMANKIKIYQYHLRRYEFALMYGRNKKVLDAACGCGFGTNILSDVTKDILGIDNSEEAIDYARSYYSGRFQVVDLEKDFPEEKFDIVISFETIEHLENPEFFLKNVKENSNGLLFSIPVNEDNKFHKKVYSVDDIINLIKEYYDKIDIFSQQGGNIFKGIRKPKYLIGYAT